jgi:hypothetical protein
VAEIKLEKRGSVSRGAGGKNILEFYQLIMGRGGSIAISASSTAVPTDNANQANRRPKECC